MADALCGPSNALQQFQKHSSADRSLQQDRLVSGRPQQEHFRSLPAPEAGTLDAEFEAFQAGILPEVAASELESSGARPFARDDAPYLTRDLQRVRLSDTSLLPALGLALPSAPSGFGTANEWQQEFLGEQGQIQTDGIANSSSAALTAPDEVAAPYVAAQRTMPRWMTSYSSYQQRPAATAEILDELAFAKAFDEAWSEMERQDSEGLIEEPDLRRPENVEGDSTISLKDDNHHRIGADTIPDPSTNPTTRNDKDELAREAGRLLESVKDDRRQKFVNSGFLGLMRQLRDRDLEVEGNQIVKVQKHLP
ncbi:MAG: hypothetical protein M1826_005456 [Phylliscum demangeonii]|nr:MAG: hypothetical protein M1826_005456 [Phylliscum demangeonii]